MPKRGQENLDEEVLYSRMPQRRKLYVEEDETPAAASTKLSRDDYSIGWICALPIEMVVAQAMLDEVHESQIAPPNDDNSYVLGRIGQHNIVIACLPSGKYGVASAAVVANQMLASFRSIRFGLLVGIAGGVPSKLADIRLGDVVVGLPTGNSGGVIQIDFGKVDAGGHFQQVGALNQPPSRLLSAVAKLRSKHMMHDSQIPEFLSMTVSVYPRMATICSYRGQEYDRLFHPEYAHTQNDTCDDCDPNELVSRPARFNTDPVIHYGPIGSGNMVMKDGITRDQLAQKYGVICFEMEAAGLMNNFPGLVIRGICDYADSHKNKQWQEYAAATAAAYAKELLLVINITELEETPRRAPEAGPSLRDILKRQDRLLDALESMTKEFQHARHVYLSTQEPGESSPRVGVAMLDKGKNPLLSVTPEASNEEFLKASNPGRRPAGPKDGDTHEPRLASTSKAPAKLPSAPKRRQDFEIAIICAKTLEADAVEASFDHRWNSSGKARGDPNAYSTGVIGRHNVVLAHMPGMGKENATSVANNFKVSFPNIKLALVVGICGGVPFVNNGHEILLGDVVISDGLIQYDFGREYDDRFVRKDSVLDNPGKQNEEIRSFMAKLKGRWSRKTLHDATSEYLGFLRKELGESAAYPGADEDKLFDPKYRHKHQDPSSCADCAKCIQHMDPVCEAARKLTCEELMCDKTHLVLRRRLSTIPSDSLRERGDMDPQPVVHFGTVACGDKVMKSGQERDKIARSEGIIAFEMEGVGVWDRLPCLVIKGISDYADSHKSEKWQHYAACAAAACTKAFLEQWAVTGK